MSDEHFPEYLCFELIGVINAMLLKTEPGSLDLADLYAAQKRLVDVIEREEKAVTHADAA